ncbi:hypothetical protein QN400_21440 [Pseudomonas sp. RTC3]|uniref:hypothetical protein n=1 Tax=Pseudomonas sp. 5C2 TaxID=3048588 RepID=UPI002AB42C91|nr:hypothetical protein [Pseudomonas sp. 5C2]MDY7567518.1 hypothetical protein [Pseudomonas sp. 5C2]MEB0064581.1 hypothetical protein [Pseudomonas sp. RTC3]MEB0243011.1 hypothetical protein [Pseudomonas sp. 5C2]
MAGVGRDEQLEPFGRIRLDRIYGDWASGHHLNPRLLASELAATLATCALPNQPIQTMHASVFSKGRSDRTIPVTFDALAAYFDSASTGQQALTIATSSGPVPAASVLIWRKWIERLVDEATERAEYAAGIAQPANDSGTLALVINGSAAASHELPLPRLSGSAPAILKAHQAQLRREGEKSASEQLDEAQAGREKAEQELVKLSAQLEITAAQNQHLMDELELQRRELSEERRARLEAEDENIRMEEQFEQVMGLAEFMNQDNQLSPPDGRLIVECWCDVTQNGATAPGIGWSTIVTRWFKARGVTLPAIKVKLFVIALAGSDRKKGGAIARSGNKG